MSSALILVALILNVVGVVLLVWRARWGDEAAGPLGRSQPRGLPVGAVGVALIASAFALLLIGQLEVTLAFWYLCVWTHLRRPRATERELLDHVDPRALPRRAPELPEQGRSGPQGLEELERSGSAVRMPVGTP